MTEHKTTGYFDNDNREYVITDIKPRRPLYNYLWNDRAVCQCDQFGNGFSWMSVGTQRRDIERGERNVYIRDNTTGESYSANRNYNDLPFAKHQCHVGLGYQRVVSEYNGLKTTFTVLVPQIDAVTLFSVDVENTFECDSIEYANGDSAADRKNRDLSIYFCIQPKPALSWHDAYGYAAYDKELNGLMYKHDGFRLPNGYTKLFVGCDSEFTAYDTGYENFRGEYNGFDNPIGLKNKKLSCRGATFQTDYVAAFQFDRILKPGEHFKAVFCAFAETSEEKCFELKNKYLAQGVFDAELLKQVGINNDYIDKFTLSSPDEVLNTQVNIWLKRQLSLGKTWGRLYGKGYRDVMQDITAFTSFDTDSAKKSLLNALKYQYEDGNPIRMFEPNFHYPYNDGGVWITGAVLSYLNESGDISVLDEEVTFLKGQSKDSFSFADAFIEEEYVAGDSATVFLHIKRAIDYLLQSRGGNNLVLWLGGDWNDSLNNAGTQGKGESVWLSIATIKAINEFSEIAGIYQTYKNCKLSAAEYNIEEYKAKKQELEQAVQAVGFRNGHYIYGINDYNEVVGGADRLFLNPQTWAVLAGLGDREKLQSAMRQVEEKLKCGFGYVQCFPSFDKGDEHIGRVSYFQKGLVENGAVYNHGVAFKIVADCMSGQGDLAYQTLKLISFDNPENANNGMEPYAVSNMYMGPENPYIAGYAPMSWITGTAGWIYRAVTEYICGIRPSVGGLKIKPCFPCEWNNVFVKRVFRGVEFNIFFVRSDKYCLVVDGVEQSGDYIPLGNNKKVNVVCYFN